MHRLFQLFRLFPSLSLSGIGLPPAFADTAGDANSPLLHFSGFGTVGINESGERNADWRATNEELSGVGRSTDRSAAPDSLFAVPHDHPFAGCLFDQFHQQY